MTRKITAVLGNGRTNRRDEFEGLGWVWRKPAFIGPITAMREPMAALHQLAEPLEKLNLPRLGLPNREDVAEFNSSGCLVLDRAKAVRHRVTS